MKYDSVALVLGYNQVFFRPEVLDFLPIYFPHILSIYVKSDLVTCWERADLLALVCGVFCEFVTFPLVSCVRCGT